MIKRLKTVLQQSTLLKVGSFNSLSVVIKMITGLGVSKLTALYLGPEGIALLGNLRNGLNIFHKFSSAGLDNAVVKYSSEYQSKPGKLNAFISTLVWFGILSCILTIIVILLFSSQINSLIFGTRDFVAIIKILGFLLPFHVLNLFLISVLKGFGEFTRVIRINIATHVSNVALFALLLFLLDLKGALLAMIIVPSAMLLFTIYHCQQHFKLITAFSLNQFSKPVLKNLGQFSFMTLISSITFPLMFLGLRNFIIENIGEQEAGYWESMIRISTYYLMFVISLLNLYILPQLASANTNLQFKNIIISFYKQILPFFTIGLLVVYVLREWIIKLVFSEAFLPATELFFWQIIGDFFRILALVMAYQFHAKKMMWHYIFTDLFLALSLYVSAVYLITLIGLEGVVMGHAITYLAYFIIIVIIFRKPLILDRS